MTIDRSKMTGERRTRRHSTRVRVRNARVEISCVGVSLERDRDKSTRPLETIDSDSPSSLESVIHDVSRMGDVR